jgi:hypothetical protein
MFAIIFAVLGWGAVGWLLVSMWDTRYQMRQLEKQIYALQRDFLAETQLRYGEFGGEE